MDLRRHAWLSGLLLLSLSSGCGDDRATATGNFSAGNNEATSGSESATSVGDGDGDGDPGDGDGDGTGDGDGAPGDGDGTPGDGDGTPGDGDGTPGDGDGDGAPACPTDPGDDACTVCLSSSCCAELMACEADDQCVCYRDCLTNGNNANTCKNMCGVQGKNDNYQALNGCSNSFCAADC